MADTTRKRVWKIDYFESPAHDGTCASVGDPVKKPKHATVGAAPSEYNPRHYFVQYLTRFQAREKFGMAIHCDMAMTPDAESRAEAALLSELHNIIVCTHDVWAPGNIRPWMIKHAITIMRVRQQCNAYPGDSPLGRLRVNRLHDHVMLLWSKLAERKPPTFTPGQERFILSTYDRMQEEAKKQGVPNLFPASYLLFKICQTLSFHNIYPAHLIVCHKNKWPERYDAPMEAVFDALGREWIPTPTWADD